MKKVTTILAAILLMAVGATAQKLSYQAVVRNSSNELVPNTALTVEVSVLDAVGTVQYAETHSAITNENGLLVLTIGDGTVTAGTTVADVNWNGAVIRSVVKNGSTVVATINSPVNAVPYALQAGNSAGSLSQVNADWEATSGVAEILHKPTIPTTVAQLTDAGDYVTDAELAAADYLTSETDPSVPAWAKESEKPVYDYSEITNTPDMTPYLTTESDPTVNNSTITIQQNGDLVGSFTLNQAGDQTLNITVPTSGGGSVPQTLNISGNVITLSDGGGSVTLPAETDPTVPAWAKESVKPVYDYSEITNTPDLTPYLTSETDPTVPAWAKESVKPTYDYSEITNTPDLTPYLTAETDPTVPAWAKESVKPVYDYSEITNTPDLTPYLTSETDPSVNNSTITIQQNGDLVGSFTLNQAGDQTLNIAVPIDVSAFNNDAGYITNSNTSCANTVDLCELLEKLQQLETQLEFNIFTQGVTAVTQNSFTVNGKVQTDGTATVTQRGFVYSSTNPTPTFSDYHVNCGSGTGTYSYTITGLTPGITYYVRAFATNENGTFYGSVVAVTTTATSPSTLPSVTTIAVTDVGKFRATVSGSVTSDGGESVTQRGFVYGTSPNPTTSNASVTSGGGTGDYTILLSSLQAGTTYYVRAFAVNSKGRAYGNQLTFNTTADEQPAAVGNDGQPCPGTPTVTDHEGNVYNTVQIGTQCWTKENMRATTSPSTGTYLIPPAGTTYTYSGKQARWYNNDSATYAPQNYGLLYNWNAAVDTFNTTYGETSVIPFVSDDMATYVVSVNFSGHRRGICPQGWHVPKDGEWTTLTNYMSSQANYYYYDDESYDVPVTNTSYIAKALASTNGWWTADQTFAVGNNQGTNNASGFSAVPAGYCYGSSFYYAGYRAYFWSSTQNYSGSAYYRALYYYDAYVNRDANGKSYGYSVRCLRD